VIVIMLAALAWWSGLFNSIPGLSQSAALGTNAPAVIAPPAENVTSESLAQDLAAVDAQIKLNVADIALADAAFALKMTGVADRIQQTASSLREFSRRTEARVAMKNNVSLTASWKEIGIKASDATSLGSTAKTKAEYKASNDKLAASYSAAATVLAAVK